MGLSNIEEESEGMKKEQIKNYNKYFNLIGVLSINELIKLITFQFKIDHHIEFTNKEKLEMYVIGNKIERVIHEV